MTERNPRSPGTRKPATKGKAAGEKEDLSSPEGPSFEDAFAVAESAVETLERGDLSLEDSLRKYEEGLRALQRCHEVLRQAERRIEVLGSELGSVADGSEGPVWRPAAGQSALREALGAIERDDAPVDGTTGEPVDETP